MSNDKLVTNPGNYRGAEAVKEERQLRALRLRTQGFSYREIGRALQVSHVQAFRDVQSMIKELHEECKEEARAVKAIEIERLDKALESIWDEVEKGNLLAIDRMIKIQERRSRYEGLDAPTKQEMDIVMPEPIKFVQAPERIDE